VFADLFLGDAYPRRKLKVLTSFFPTGWQQMAWQSGAVERLRGFSSPDVVAYANAACGAGLLIAGDGCAR
jgi:hypothetical protein